MLKQHGIYSWMRPKLSFWAYKDPGNCRVNLHKISAFDFLQANMHDLQLEDIVDTDNTPPDPDDDHGDAGTQADEDNSTELLTFLTKQQGSTHPGCLANVLSTSKTSQACKRH